ncbi:hypothetical protein [Coleofasciculus sp.]|uniref:hypothetical protein n=1 Tax=Coleofasciculus sp. TaxID=3100458 RepID=UPI003A342607
MGVVGNSAFISILPLTTTPHPEVTEQTPYRGDQTFASPLTCESLQHLPSRSK